MFKTIITCKHYNLPAKAKANANTTENLMKITKRFLNQYDNNKTIVTSDVLTQSILKNMCDLLDKDKVPKYLPELWHWLLFPTTCKVK